MAEDNFVTFRKLEEFGHNGLGLEIRIKYPGDMKTDFDGENGHIFYHIEDDLINHMRKVYNSKDPKRIAERIEDKKQMLTLFNQPIFVEEIPNGYCSRGCCADKPWFIVTTTIGRFKIGWRKSVIHLEWTETINKTEAKVLFPNEDVTRYDRVIHAWSPEICKEYIEKIIQTA